MEGIHPVADGATPPTYPRKIATIKGPAGTFCVSGSESDVQATLVALSTHQVTTNPASPILTDVPWGVTIDPVA